MLNQIGSSALPFQLSFVLGRGRDAPIFSDSPSGEQGESGRNQDHGRIALLSELPFRRAGTLTLLRAQARAKVTPFRDASDLLAQALAGGDGFSCILIDVGGHRLTEAVPVEVLRRMREAYPAVPIVALSDREEPDEILVALKNGLRGFIPANVEPEVARRAVRLVLAGGSYFPAAPLIALSRQLSRDPANGGAADQARSGSWSPRQLAVLRLLVRAKTNKEIARELKMEESTVKVHVWHIMKRLDAANRTEAALRARALRVLNENEHGTDQTERPTD